MAEVKRKPLDFEEYLALERSGDIRYELIGGELYAMTGGTDIHNLITLDLREAIKQRLRGRRCRVFSEGMKLRVAEDAYYPDVMVICAERDSHPLYKTEPILLAEVLSENTRRHDRVIKLRIYQQIASLQAYLILSQDVPRIEAYTRRDDTWTRQDFGLDGEVYVPGLDIRIPVREVYAEVLDELGYSSP